MSSEMATANRVADSVSGGSPPTPGGNSRGLPRESLEMVSTRVSGEDSDDSAATDVRSGPATTADASSVANSVVSDSASQEESEESSSSSSTSSSSPDRGESSVAVLAVGNITARDVEKLNAAGHMTVRSVAYATKRRLCAIPGIGEEKTACISREAQSRIDMGFSSGQAVLRRRSGLIRITTGSKRIDEILGGGVECGTLTEIYGEFGSGKTQLCITMSIACQLPAGEGGGSGRCIYLDTEGSFRPERAEAVARRFGLSEREALQNIKWARCRNTEHQTDLLTKAAALLYDNWYALIVVDGATALFRSEYHGRAELAARQTQLGSFLRTLRKMADEFGVAVVYTNKVVARVDGVPEIGGEPYDPVGGHVVGHASTTRLSLRRCRGRGRVGVLYKSPLMPEGEAPFVIGEGGVEDSQ